MTSQSTEPRVWFITGASAGFGAAIAREALDSGDLVVATARDRTTLESLVASAPTRVMALDLDVTDLTQAERAVHDALLWQGRIDVLVNNAGRGQVGSAEETSAADLQSMFDVHLFGPAALVRATLPHMRRRRSGAIVQMSSFGGQVAPAGFSAYCSTKFALEGYSEALAAEVGPLGIRVLIVEPGAFRTNFSGSALLEGSWSEDYEPTVGATRTMVKGIDGQQPGDPALAARAIRAALDDPDGPMRLPLGEDAVAGIRGHAEAIISDLDKWLPASLSASSIGDNHDQRLANS